jgi:hypothetical protein
VKWSGGGTQAGHFGTSDASAKLPFDGLAGGRSSSMDRERWQQARRPSPVGLLARERGGLGRPRPGEKIFDERKSEG